LITPAWRGSSHRAGRAGRDATAIRSVTLALGWAATSSRGVETIADEAPSSRRQAEPKRPVLLGALSPPTVGDRRSRPRGLGGESGCPRADSHGRPVCEVFELAGRPARRRIDRAPIASDPDHEEAAPYRVHFRSDWSSSSWRSTPGHQQKAIRQRQRVRRQRWASSRGRENRISDAAGVASRRDRPWISERA